MSKSEKSKDFFNNPENYLTSNVIIVLRKKIIAELLYGINNKRIIDIGCGNGELTIDLLKNNRVTFLDISSNMLSLVKEKIQKENLQNASFINSDFSLYTPEDKFDVAVCVGVVAHVESLKELIGKLKEIINDDGIIILQYTAAEKLISRFNQLKCKILNIDHYNYQINITSSDEINEALTEEHLTTIKKTRYIPVSPLLSIFSYKFKLKLLSIFYKTKLFSYIGSEIIVYLVKGHRDISE
jgi:cyclopropane fatty-acyl-phospholipid synthase-like methyltransferase